MNDNLGLFIIALIGVLAFLLLITLKEPSPDPLITYCAENGGIPVVERTWNGERLQDCVFLPVSFYE